MKRLKSYGLALLTAAGLLLQPVAGHAVVDGITGPTFNLTARQALISTADGNSITVWGYGVGDNVQYPGPTLIVNEGETVTVNLVSQIARPDGSSGQVPTSIVFPGQEVTATGGSPGLLTRESSGSGDTVTYTFTAKRPGTYQYHSGTQPDLQVEMGLMGALIVRPSLGANYAYNDPATRFDHEYLFLLSEMDVNIHYAVDGSPPVDENGHVDVDTSDYFSVYWFINGRNGPDTMADAFVPWLPTQPYNSLPRTRPGEKVLLRVIGAGRQLHPFHTHGNNALVVGRDGRLLSSGPGQGADLSFSDYTIQSVPGTTYDALFSWTGKGLGWDIYGDPADPEHIHDCVDSDGDGFDDTRSEYCADHGKPLPVVLPENQDLTFGGWYSGSPFLGTMGGLPPGEGGLNLNGGLYYMWHSHTEKELTNYDIFPGGMMTMLIVEPPGVPIP